jgi:glycosyltransferase involved in cell wall biosynthesis
MRYSKDWRDWFPNELIRLGAEVCEYNGAMIDSTARTAVEFADWTQTWAWKGGQLEDFATRFASTVHDGDWVLSLEGWGPASVAAKYMAAMTGKRIKVASFFHAGLFDPWDRLSQVPPVSEFKWMRAFESSLIHATDLILCGSAFCETLIRRYHPDVACSFAHCGCPVYRNSEVVPFNERDRTVVFPHRFATEKDIPRARRIEARVQEVNARRGGSPIQFIYTQQDTSTKADYYAALSVSRVAYSTALQETFGIAMQEAAAAGCWIVCPNSLSYPEVVRGAGSEFLFDSDLDAAESILTALDRDCPAPWDGWHESAIERAYSALLNHKEQP